MDSDFLSIATTPSVRAAQADDGGAGLYDKVGDYRRSHQFSDTEAAFIADHDSFNLASVSESGWPFVQHRGGSRGLPNSKPKPLRCVLRWPLRILPHDRY